MITLNEMEDNFPGKFIEINEVGIKRLGYNREELLNMTPRDIVAPDKRPEMPENAAKLIKNSCNTFEIVHMTKNGDRIPVEVNNHLINYKGRKACLAISRDITERKKAEKALQESEGRLKIAMDMAKLVYWEYDVESDMFTFDNRFYTIYGTTAEYEGSSKKIPLMNMPERFIPPEESHLVAEEIAQALETDDPNFFGQSEHANTIIRADGEKRSIIFHSCGVWGYQRR